MPMIEFTYPDGALEEEPLSQAVEKLTSALLRHEGAPDDECNRAIAWVFLNPVPWTAINVGGRPAEKPHYRLLITTPEGTFFRGPSAIAQRQRRSLVRDVAEIVLEAEGTVYTPEEEARVWCVINEVQDAFWGAFGQVWRFEDVISYAASDTADIPLAGEEPELFDVRAFAGASGSAGFRSSAGV